MYDFLKYILQVSKNSIGVVALAVIIGLAGLITGCSVFHKKHNGRGHFPWEKGFLWLVFAGYIAVIVSVTLLRQGGGYKSWNLHLFRAWLEAWNNYSVKSWSNVLLNIAIFLPLGALLPLLGKPFRKWYRTIPAGFAVSLSIELLQLAMGTGIWDVDDLFTNTLGTAIGFLLIMAVLALFREKECRLKPCLAYSGLLLAILASIGSIFLSYHLQEYGNLPTAPAYRINMGDTRWELRCQLPVANEILPVYRTQNRTLKDCDAFARDMAKLENATVDSTSYYQDFAYYMLYSGEAQTGVLQVSYYDESYEYFAMGNGFNEDFVAVDRETMEATLGRYPVSIPACAAFFVDEDKWHIFSVDMYLEGDRMYDGTLRCRYSPDGTLTEIENNLLSYHYYDTVSVISPTEAYQALCAGSFNDDGYFERIRPEKLVVLSCELAYEIDTKGFYQPVYLFAVEAEDDSYKNTVMIPAMQ